MLSAGVIVAGSGAVPPSTRTIAAAAGSSSPIASTTGPHQAQASAGASAKRSTPAHQASTKSRVRSFTVRRPASDSPTQRDYRDTSMPTVRPGGGQQQAPAQGGGPAQGASLPGSGGWGSSGSGGGGHDGANTSAPGAQGNPQPA